MRTWIEMEQPEGDCPHCGDGQIETRYGMIYWRCGSFWTHSPKGMFHASDRCEILRLESANEKLGDAVRVLLGINHGVPWHKVTDVSIESCCDSAAELRRQYEEDV